MYIDCIQKIVQRKDLTEQETASVMEELLSGSLTDTQIAAFMAALATKGETADELGGAARTMRKTARRIQTDSPIVVDTCGTGGDMAGTFNISTTTAFVVAGCGVTVAKHGNRSVSSKCGSADLLEALGVSLSCPPEVVEEAVNGIGIGFLFAPLYHGAMRHAAKARSEVRIRSLFNMLGPLTNPAGANCQLLGVYASSLTELFAQALKNLGSRRAMVVCGHDGLDEISVAAPTRISELMNGTIRTYDLFPDMIFGHLADPEALRGGDAQTNAAITRAILSGESGDARNCVLLNAAAALVCAEKASDIPDGIRMAQHAIDSGKAMEKLQALVRFTQEAHQTES
ncbi:MAG: anthranilate phosphoribosyltransferase [Thermodesulfobacteriota bacterium]